MEEMQSMLPTGSTSQSKRKHRVGTKQKMAYITGSRNTMLETVVALQDHGRPRARSNVLAINSRLDSLNVTLPRIFRSCRIFPLHSLIKLHHTHLTLQQNVAQLMLGNVVNGRLIADVADIGVRRSNHP